MIKALLKKQAGELLSFMTSRGKSGKDKGKKMGIAYAIIVAYAFVAVGVMMYNIADSLCEPLITVGMDWLFFAIIGFFAIGLSVIFGIFTSQPMLYDARDNDFLLSLPIPASKILFSRVFLLYAQNLLCYVLIFVPALVVYAQTVDVNMPTVALQVLIVLIFPLLSLVVECVVGWLVALISSRMRKKNLVTLVLSLALLAGYFYLTTKMPEYMSYIVENSQQMGTNIMNVFYPFYQMGLGASGDVKGFLIFTAILLVLFAAAYFVLSLSFIRIITTKKGIKKVKYTGQILKARSYRSALFHKELTRFFTTPMYLLNCGLGAIFHIAIMVLAIVKKDELTGVFAVIPVFTDNTMAMMTAIVCLLGAMDMITAPSISLEGKNIWILQTMPIDGWEVIKAKLKLHLVVNLPTSVLCAAVLGVVLDIGAVGVILSEIFTVIFVCFCAVMGLVCNIKMPNLNWTSAAIVIKQSASVLISMLVNMGAIFALGGLYYLMEKIMSAEIIISMFIVAVAVVTVAFTLNLKNKGSKKFTYL